MICKPEEAKNYHCCAMPKMCEGDKCMAWKTYYAPGEQQKGSNGFPPPPPKPVKTDMGYCGRS